MKRHPLPFILYVLALLAGLTAGIAYLVRNDPSLTVGLLELGALAGLLAVAEHSDLSFYDGRVRIGLAAGEVVFFPMLVALSSAQVVIGAVIAMGAIRAPQWRHDPLKETFNVAQYGTAAFAAAMFWRVTHEGTAFTLRNAAAGAVAIIIFAVATHILIPVGIWFAGQGRLRDALDDLAPPVFLNLAGNVVLGLFLAAAYVAAPWMLLLFPVALAGLYFAFRAVVRQGAERERIEQLHEASRSLVGTAELGRALDGFLVAVADVASALGARAVIRTRHGLLSSAIYEGAPIETLVSVEGEPVEAFLDFVRETRRTLIFGGDHDPVPDALRMGDGGRNLVCVPVFEDGAVTGLLMVTDRVGADEFGTDETRLLEALANDLALTLQSYRLFEEINEEKEKFQLLVEAVSDYAIYMLDPAGKVVSWNSGAERILGYTSEEILGKHHSCFYPPEARGAWHDELNEAAGRGHVEAEGGRLRKDGSMFLANEVITPVRDLDGELRGFAKITRDITERVQAQEEKWNLQAQLHQAQKLESVGQLAGGIAHDFNNLLAVISGSAQFMIDQLPEEQELREDLLEIRSAAKRGSALTRQLLIFSRRDATAPDVLDLNEVIRPALKLLSRALGERIEVQADLDPDLPNINADYGQMEQVLMNLAINARDAMPAGGTVTIRTSPVEVDEEEASRVLDLVPGHFVKMTVTDTGTGMSEDVLQKAFEPFFTTKPKSGGTGLGLATVYGIVKGAEGHITIASEEGRGTTFEILFPVSTEPATKVEETIDLRGPGPQGAGETILLVEDDAAVRAVTKRILETHAYKVIEAPGGKDALMTFDDRRSDIDLLVTDIVMPDISGVELAGRLRSISPDLKVLFMSGYSPAVFTGGEGDFEDPLIQKPFERDDLLHLIKQVLHTDPASTT
ncbi:MAG: PAS domain S-box protein [Actinomycetota bacterium]